MALVEFDENSVGKDRSFCKPSHDIMSGSEGEDGGLG